MANWAETERTPVQVVQALCEEIRAISQDPKIASLTDKISVITAAHLAPDIDHGLGECGLTRSEFRLTEFLRSKRGALVSHDTALSALYFDRCGHEPQPKIIDIFICRIRQKFKARNAPYRIETVRGHGFRFVHAEAA